MKYVKLLKRLQIKGFPLVCSNYFSYLRAMKSKFEIKYNTRVFIQIPKTDRNKFDAVGPVMCRVRWNSKKNEVGLRCGVCASIDKWNEQSSTVKRNTTHIYKGRTYYASDINFAIAHLLDCVSDVFKSFEVKQAIPSQEEFKDAVYKKMDLDNLDVMTRKRQAGEDIDLEKIKKEENKTFWDVYDEWLADGLATKHWSHGTHKKYMTLKYRLVGFDKNLLLEDITEKKIAAFENYLLDQRDYKNSSVKRHIKTIHGILSWCKKKGYKVEEKAVDYKSSLREVFDPEIIFLNWDEFKTLYDYEIPVQKQYLQRVKDVFIFACVTGLRFSDVEKLHKDHIHWKEDEFISVSKKTSNNTHIGLNKYSREILEKYKHINFPGGMALPVISNQKTNTYLKELCHLAGLTSHITIASEKGSETIEQTFEKWEKISFHCARRTYVSIALSLGATPEEVSRVSGHHSYKVMKRYIGLDEKQRRHATDVFDEKTEREELYSMFDQMSVKDLRTMLYTFKKAANI